MAPGTRHVKLSEETWQHVRARAEAENMPIRWWIERVLQAALSKGEKK